MGNGLICACNYGGGGGYGSFTPPVQPLVPPYYPPTSPPPVETQKTVVKPEPTVSCSSVVYVDCQTVIGEEETITNSVPPQQVTPPTSPVPLQPPVPPVQLIPTPPVVTMLPPGGYGVGGYGGGSSACMSSCEMGSARPTPVTKPVTLPARPTPQPTSPVTVTVTAQPQQPVGGGSNQRNCVCDIPSNSLVGQSSGSQQMNLQPAESYCVTKEKARSDYEDCITNGINTTVVSGLELPTYTQPQQGLTCVC